MPEYVELGGNLLATYVYVANSHDGSMAVTAAVTPIRIVCANTLGAALRQAEHGVNAQRTFRFRHTGNLQAKFAEARQVLGMTINDQKQFKAARGPDGHGAHRRVGARAPTAAAPLADRRGDGQGRPANRERTIEQVLAVFGGRGVVDDTTGNSPGSNWVAFNAIAEHLAYGRRYTTRTNQVQRSFEDTGAKQRALALVLAA